MNKFLIHYQHDCEKEDTMIITAETEAEAKEIFYDSCPDDNPKISIQKEEEV